MTKLHPEVPEHYVERPFDIFFDARLNYNRSRRINRGGRTFVEGEYTEYIVGQKIEPENPDSGISNLLSRVEEELDHRFPGREGKMPDTLLS